MIPNIRSMSELMAITLSREINKNNLYRCNVKSGEIKSYEIAKESKVINLPNLPKKIRRKWVNNKKSLSKFIDTLDYNNQIQSSYDLTLIERQSQNHREDVA